MIKINVHSSMQKEELFREIEHQLTSFMHIRYIDQDRPWGGFFVIDENDADDFIRKIFPLLSKEYLSISGKLSPKILVVAPGKRLSWQYHNRRAEVWKLLEGEAEVVMGDSDSLDEAWTKKLQPGETVELKNKQRHRLVGLENWGIIAEIWQHVDAELPSDEEDIVRVQDDFGR